VDLNHPDAHDATGGVLAFWIATAFVAGFLLCLAIGFLTGVIVAVIGVHPILVTLGTQTLVSGISIWLTHRRTLSGFPEPLLLISNGTIFGIPMVRMGSDHSGSPLWQRQCTYY
jgi:simple sugar transport system permease protein